MKIRQIRNATLVLEIGGTKLLVDPWLAPASDKFPGPTAPLNVVTALLLTVKAYAPSRV